MLNLDKVKGAVVTQDGNYYPFGKQQTNDQTHITSENYHNTSFNHDIVPQQWFQDLNYKFTLQDMYFHVIQLSSKGLVIILHDKLPHENDLFIINTPLDLSQEQKQFFKENYSYFQSLIDNKKATFEATAYKENGVPAWYDNIKTLNEFYDKLNIKSNNKTL